MKKVLSKGRQYYNAIPLPAKASIWFTICSVIQRGIALLSTPIFTRVMTTDQYGVYTVYQSWYAIVTIFATLNLYAGVYNNGMTKWPEDRPRYTSALQGLSTVLTVGLFAVYLVNMDYWNNLMGLSTLFVLAMFIESLFVPAYNFWSAGQRFDYKYKKLVIVSLFIGIASPVLGLLAVLCTEYKAEARVISYVLVQVCVGLIFYIYNMYKGRKFYVKSYWKFALAFNLPLIPHYLSQTILNQADRIMIADMCGESDAAIYNVAYSFAMIFTIVTTAVNNTFIPYTYKVLRDKTYTALRRTANFLVLMVGAFCIIAMAFGPEIIRIFAAPQYYEARWVLPPVAEALLFMFIYPLFCNIEFYYEKTKFIMLASGGAAVVNVALNYIFIGRFGYLAAAYTTLACYILLAVVHYAAAKIICRQEGIEVQLYDMRFLVLLSIASMAVMVFMTAIYDHIIIRYAIILGFAIVAYKKRAQILETFKTLKSKD